MLLAVDIGNSEITIGLWANGKWTEHWRILSRPEQQEAFYAVTMRGHFFEARIPLGAVTQVVMSSVVPALTDKIQHVLHALFERPVILLGPEIYKRLPIQVLNPHEIGSDLVANAMAAFMKYHTTCIVVDFGTALTFTTISGEGRILGVSIAPGLQTAIRSLSDNTARLFEVPLELPESALGTSTITAIQTGVIIGYEGIVRQVSGRIREELKVECPVIATGGLSNVITPLIPYFHAIEPRLTLDGLRIIAGIEGSDFR